MDPKEAHSNRRTRKSAPTKNAVFVGAMHKERSKMQSRPDSCKAEVDTKRDNDTISIGTPQRAPSNFNTRQLQRMSTPVRTCKTSPRSHRGRRTKHEYDSDHDRSRSIASSTGSRRKFHPNYDPVIEIRRAKERLERYNTQGDWKVDMLLGDDADEDLNKYEEKLKRRLSERGELVEPIQLERRQVELLRRQRDIDMGKVAPRYSEYVFSIPKPERQRYHPRTPNKFRKVSRRAWDGMIRKWRKHLHSFEDMSFEDSWRSLSTADMSGVSGMSTPSEFSMGDDISLASLSDIENEKVDPAQSGRADRRLTASPTVRLSPVVKQEPVTTGRAQSGFSVMQPKQDEEEEDTLQAHPKFSRDRQQLTSCKDEDTLSSLPTVVSPRRFTRNTLSKRRSAGPTPDVLHSGLTNDIASISAPSSKRSASRIAEKLPKVVAAFVDITNQSEFPKLRSASPTNHDPLMSPSKRARRGILSQNHVCWPAEQPSLSSGERNGKA